MLEELRIADGWISSVISRAYQYVRMMMNDFERLRVVHDFRQPSSFIGYELVYLILFPLLLAPHFAQISRDSGLWAGIYSSVFSSVLVIGLFQVIHDTDDPFDGFGIDDLDIHMIEEAPLHMWRMQTKMPSREVFSNNGKAAAVSSQSMGPSLQRSSGSRSGTRRRKRSFKRKVRLEKSSVSAEEK
jgi:hypothetical protein